MPYKGRDYAEIPTQSKFVCRGLLDKMVIFSNFRYSRNKVQVEPFRKIGQKVTY